jgi:hypothetical protein
MEKNEGSPRPLADVRKEDGGRWGVLSTLFELERTLAGEAVADAPPPVRCSLRSCCL